MFVCIYSPNTSADMSLADFAYAFSPIVEETARDIVVIDAAGCELLFGSGYELANEIANRAAQPKNLGGLGSRINVALAANPDTAIFAARFFKGITFISPGEELTGLGELPIEELNPRCPMSNYKRPTSAEKALGFGLWTLDKETVEEIIETLKLWGIRTFHDFAMLPVKGVAERLGQEGVVLQQLAGGKTARHLRLIQPPPDFENSIELEYPLVELEPLSFILARLLNQLCAKLNAYALATNELRICLKLANETSHERMLNLPYPMRDPKTLLKLLLLDTELHPPQSAVVAITIVCDPVKPRLLQNGLFIPRAPEPEKLELTLARLAKLVGPENVGSPQLIDTHRPDAFCVKRFVLQDKPQPGKRRSKNSQSAVRSPQFLLGFRMFRPPLRAMVEAVRGYPTQISAWGLGGSVYGKILKLAGPWRTTGDWWRNDTWARDEWDVAVESRGASREGTGPALKILYRIYRELDSNAWFVEGVYD